MYFKNKIGFTPLETQSRVSAGNSTRSLTGFTLVETMVAIAVLAIALVGPFVAIQTALNASYVARDGLVASALAQEGMEYIRSVRDNNYLAPRADWMVGLKTLSCYGANPAGYCTVDPILGDVNTTPSAVVSYASLSAVPVLKVTSSGLYNHQNLATNTSTRFTRTVRIKSISTTEVQVTVIVSWISAHQNYSVTVVDNLRDWI